MKRLVPYAPFHFSVIRPLLTSDPSDHFMKETEENNNARVSCIGTGQTY